MSTKQPTILVIDDEEFVTNSVKKITEKYLNWECLTCNDPLEGLQILKQNQSLFGFGKNKIDCVIVDFKMPNMNGFELITAWRKHEKRNAIPIILLTAYEDEKKWKEVVGNKDLDICAFINKPIKRTILKDLLEKIVIENDITSIKNKTQDQSYERIHEIKNKHEYKTAQEMQKSVLPNSVPSMPNVDVNVIFKTSKFVGGDFYDFYPLSETKLGVAIIDIIGKGIPACMLMMRLRELLQRYVSEDKSPAEFLKQMNTVLCNDDTFPKGAPIFYGILDIKTKTFTYSNTIGNAGGLHLSSNDTITYLDKGGFMVGADPDETFEEETIPIDSSSHLLLYTDGIIEQENEKKEQFGQNALKASLINFKKSEETNLAQYIFNDLENYMNSLEHDDDTSIIHIHLNKS